MRKKLIYPNAPSRGFTITELLVVTLILGVLASVSVSYFQRSWAKEQLKLSARTVAALLEDARVTATQKIQTCKLLLNDTNTSIDYAQAGNTCTELPTLNIRTDVDYGSNIILCSRISLDQASVPFPCNAAHSNISGTEITFTPRGTAVNDALIKLAIVGQEQARCIAVVSPLGLIRQGLDNGSGCNFNIAF